MGGVDPLPIFSAASSTTAMQRLRSFRRRPGSGTIGQLQPYGNAADSSHTMARSLRSRRSTNKVTGDHGAGEARRRASVLTAGLGCMRWLANQQVQLGNIETGLAIVLPRQLKRAESILVGSKGAIDPLIQIDQAALNHEEDQRRFW